MSLNELTAYENGFNYAESLKRTHGAAYAVREHCAVTQPNRPRTEHAFLVGESDALLLMVTARE